jgi:hypothetical protein
MRVGYQLIIQWIPLQLLFSVEIQQQTNDFTTVSACIEVTVDDDNNVDQLRSVLNIFKVNLGGCLRTLTYAY